MNKIYLILLLAFLGCATADKPEEAESIIENSYRYLALGDSYTIGESVSVEGRWPEQLMDSLEARGKTFDDYKIIATTGWRTDDLSAAMDAANLTNEYNLVSLLIGVNNQYQGRSVEDYKPEFEALLARAVSLGGGKKENVFVVSIPDYAYTPFGQKGDSENITRELIEYNAACKTITIANGINHIDITPISLRGVEEPNLVASDGLHPSASQYTLWVEEILKQYFK